MLNQIFFTEFPSREDLIEYATEQVPLRWTTSKKHHDCLHFLVDSYLAFVQQQDLAEYNRRFWISDPRMTSFPEEDFKRSLKRFFRREGLWNHPYIEAMRHEHLRILFFIAALRYRRLQEPQQQIKFKEENQSEVGIIDLFLFNNDQSTPIYALQIRLLTPYDVDLQGHILETNRTEEFFNGGIDTFEKYVEDSQVTFQSSLYAVDSQSNGEAKTNGCLVLVTPYDFVWLNCGRYAENLTSQSLRQVPQKKQAKIFRRKEKYSKSKTKSVKLQYSSIPSQGLNQYAGMNTLVQPTPQPMYSPYQQFSQTSQCNGGFLNQAFAPNPFLHYLSHSMHFPLAGYGFQPNTIPAMLVMSDPSFLPVYNNPINYQEFAGQQILPGIRTNLLNGWKENAYSY